MSIRARYKTARELDKRTFIPSNKLFAYWMHDDVGSMLSGPYGLISGADHPNLGS